MDWRQFFLVFLVLTVPRFATANGPLEPAEENNDRCLQAGLIDREHWPEDEKKYFGGWTRFKKGYLVVLAKCSQSDQQDWNVEGDVVAGFGGNLSVIRLGRKFVPVVSRQIKRKHLRPVHFEQGRLVFMFRNKHYCLEGDGGLHFNAYPLEECLNSAELSKSSRWLFNLPPDPGEAGLAGLDGIDSDQDGIRDDVQRFIEVEILDSEVIRKAATQLAVAMQKKLSNAHNKEAVLQLQPESFAGSDCLFYVTGGNSRHYRKRLEAMTYNTEERLRAWNKINSYFSGMTFTLSDDLEAQCNSSIGDTAP